MFKDAHKENRKMVHDCLGEEIKRRPWRLKVPGDRRQRRSEITLVEHLVDTVADPLEVSAVHLGGTVERRQEVTVGEVIEDVVDARVALLRQVPLDGLVQQVPAVVQNSAHHAAVEGELDLMEAHRSHGQSVHLFPKVLHQDQLFIVKLVVPVEHPELHHHLDEIFDDFLRLLAVACVFFGHAVELIQDLAAGVINEKIGHTLGGHFAHQFLLSLQSQTLGAEGVHGQGHTFSELWWRYTGVVNSHRTFLLQSQVFILAPHKTVVASHHSFLIQQQHCFRQKPSLRLRLSSSLDA